MVLLTALGFSPPIQGTRVGRPWRQRLEDLIACEVDYASKTVLDAGCTLRSVETPHRLDLVNLADDERLRAVLEPGYDIVQLLAVYQHVERARGDRVARRMLATLAERCSETFIAASRPDYLPAIVEVLSSSGLRVERETSSLARSVRHLVFRRQ
jgi:hypothetical protein